MPTAPQDPAQIIEQAYDAYADAIFRHCTYRTFNRERGKDLMQETFVRVWEYLRKGEQIENIRALLYRIANNLIIDASRKKKEVSLDALSEAGFDPTGQGEDDVTKGLEQERVMQTIRQLPEASRTLILMRYVDGLKPQEIGELLNIPANTISVRIHRALCDLKDLLKAA